MARAWFPTPPALTRGDSVILFMLAAMTIGVSSFTGPAGAQTQGWIRERVGLLTLEGPPVSAAAVRSLADRAQQVLPQLEKDLGARPDRAFRIVLVPASGLDDPTLARMDQQAPLWAAGYLIPELRIGAIRIEKSSQYPYGTLESVLAHECAHMLLHDAVGRRLPLWFEEGVATSQGRRWSAEDMWTYSRVLLTSDVPNLANLDSAFHASASEAEMAYAASFSFVSWSSRKYGPEMVAHLLREMRTRSFVAAWQVVTHDPLARAEKDWRLESLIRYRWFPVVTASSTLWIGVSLLAI